MTLMRLNGVLGMVCESKSRPNFNIIEGYEVNVNYEEFKKDFLNPYISVIELREKYGMSNRVYKKYRSKILKETGLSRKPTQNYQKFIKGLPISHEFVNRDYIRRIGDSFTVVKTTGYSTHYFGRYDNFETALMVRDKLVEHNWNIEYGNELKALYSKTRAKPSLALAVKIYDEFEKRYFAREQPISEIKEDMNISKQTYSYLLKLIRNKHGAVGRWLYG